MIKEVSWERCVQRKPCQCWTKFKTDGPVAVDSYMGISLSPWRFGSFLNPIGIALKSKTRVRNYSAVLLIASLQEMPADWLLCGLSLTSMQKQLVRAIEEFNSTRVAVLLPYFVGQQFLTVLL